MTLLQMSLSGTVMILAIAAVRALTANRLPKKTFLALWGVAAVRLLIPYSLHSAFSVYSLLGKYASLGEAVNDSPAVPFTPMAAVHNVASTPTATNTAVAAAMFDPWTVVWVTGALACAAFFAVTYLKCRRVFKASFPVDNEYARLWPGEHRIHRTICPSFRINR